MYVECNAIGEAVLLVKTSPGCKLLFHPVRCIVQRLQ